MYLLFRISANDNRMFILKMIYMIIFLHALNIQKPKVSINNVPDPGFLFFYFLSCRTRVFYSPELQKPGLKPKRIDLND